MTYDDYRQLRNAVFTLEEFLDKIEPKTTPYYAIAYIVAHLGRKEVEEWSGRWDE